MITQLPPPSPALVVHQAADRIRCRAKAALAEMAGNDYWSNGWSVGVTNAIGGSEGDLAALVTPELALHIADWLDTVGSRAARTGDPIPAPAASITRSLLSEEAAT